MDTIESSSLKGRTYRETIEYLKNLRTNGKPSECLIEARKQLLDFLKSILNRDQLELVLEQDVDQFEKTYILEQSSQYVSFPEYVLGNFAVLADETLFDDLKQQPTCQHLLETSSTDKSDIVQQQNETVSRSTEVISPTVKPRKHRLLEKLDTLCLDDNDKEIVKTKLEKLLNNTKKASLRFIEQHFELFVEIVLSNGQNAKLEENHARLVELNNTIGNLKPEFKDYQNAMGVEFDIETLKNSLRLERTYYALLQEYKKTLTENLILLEIESLLGRNVDSEIIACTSTLLAITDTIKIMEVKVQNCSKNPVKSPNFELSPQKLQRALNGYVIQLTAIRRQFTKFMLEYLQNGNEELLAKIESEKIKYYNVVIEGSVLIATHKL